MKKIWISIIVFGVCMLIPTPWLGAQQCGVKVLSAINYSILGKSAFKAEFSNVDSRKVITAVEFRVVLLDSFDDVIGTQTEIWEAGDIDEPMMPGKTEYIVRVIKKDKVSRVRVSVIRVRYSDATKCYE